MHQGAMTVVLRLVGTVQDLLGLRLVVAHQR
jgi:hypothetical protein